MVRVRYCAFRGCSNLETIIISENSKLTSIEESAFYDCGSLKTIAIPDGVTLIGDGAFENCSSLSSVTISDKSQLTSIENSAFSGCNNLESITIPCGVTSIGECAFADCNSLISITIPDGVTSIEGTVFYRCSSLKSVTIPKNVTMILGNAFFGCSSLTTITISEDSKLASIGFDAFCDCSSLEAITIPERVTSIGDHAFYRCSNLTSVTIPKNSELSSIGQHAFSDCVGLASSIIIPDGVTSIGWGAFYNCSSLTSIVISECLGLTSIEGSTFRGCNSLKSITIPEGVTSIGSSAFQGCSSLEAINIPIGVKEIGDYAFFGCSNLASSIVIPEGVTSIGDYTFYNCNKLPSIAIPESITNIGYSAFYNCCSLTSIAIPDGVTSIGGGAFSNCINLAPSVYIPESVSVIESSVFAFCKGLTFITIPKSVTSIGNSAFYMCENLKDVYCYAEEVPMTDEMAFTSSGYMYGTLYVPTSAIEDYKAAVPWSSFGTIVSLTDEKVSSIILSQTTATVTEGEVLKLIATIAPDYASDPSVTWSTSNESVATVDEDGVVTAVAAGTVTITVIANDGSGVSASCEVTVEARKTSIVITDPHTEESFAQEEDEFLSSISYVRTFNNTNWQALYVPFEIPVTDELLADFEVADLNDVRQYDRDDDGVKDETVIEAFKVTSGTLEANYPYLIRAKVAGEKTITVTDATLYAAEENSIDCSSIREKFTFTGTYSRLSSEKLPQGEGYYALSGGVWQPVAEGASLGAFRFFLKVDSRDGSNAGQSNAIRMRIIGENGEEDCTTGIEEIINQKSEIIYDLQGRRVENPTKGVYIVNGVKRVF